jgi:hypothetical protein
MYNTCANSWCQTQFEVTISDREFLEKISPIFNGKKYLVPEPTRCPNCRAQRRYAFRNERNLYKRKCDKTGKDIISVFSPDKQVIVYDNDVWYGDDWSGLDYGRDYDFNRPFFSQFADLLKVTPQVSRSAVQNQNCDFTNQSGWNKNCYLIFECDHNEDCQYSDNIYDSKTSFECYQVQKVTRCYECIDCRNSYNLKYSQDCDNCSDSWFLKNCIGTKNSFACVNLRNKEYCFRNEQLSKEEYESRMAQLGLNHRGNIKREQEKFDQWAKQFPERYYHGFQNEDSTGDYLWNTQRCKNSYDLQHSQDCKYVVNSRYTRNCQDMTVFGSLEGADFSYEVHEIGGGARNVLFTDQAWMSVSNIYYSKLCIQNSSNLFGCISLKHQSYCILNKQYAEEDYNQLVPKIIEHMKSTPYLSGREAPNTTPSGGRGGEWGEFFPASLSPLGYNETVGINFMPMSQQQAEENGFNWSNYTAPNPHVEKSVPGEKLPDTIADIPDDILNWAIICQESGKPFRITPLELKFYRDQNLPVPGTHPNVSYLKRFKKRNPRQLWSRTCSQCQKSLQSTYEEGREETILCEQCYQQVVN